MFPHWGSMLWPTGMPIFHICPFLLNLCSCAFLTSLSLFIFFECGPFLSLLLHLLHTLLFYVLVFVAAAVAYRNRTCTHSGRWSHPSWVSREVPFLHLGPSLLHGHMPKNSSYLKRQVQSHLRQKKLSLTPPVEVISPTFTFLQLLSPLKTFLQFSTCITVDTQNCRSFKHAHSCLFISLYAGKAHSRDTGLDSLRMLLFKWQELR